MFMNSRSAMNTAKRDSQFGVPFSSRALNMLSLDTVILTVSIFVALLALLLIGLIRLISIIAVSIIIILLAVLVLVNLILPPPALEEQPELSYSPC